MLRSTSFFGDKLREEKKSYKVSEKLTAEEVNLLACLIKINLILEKKYAILTKKLD